MKKVLFILIPIMLSCGGEEDKVDPIDIDEFTGETGEEYTDSTGIEILDDSTELTDVSLLIRKIESVYDTTTGKGFHSLDRFGFSTSQKVNFKGKNEVPYGKSNMVFPEAEFFYYTFSDTNKTTNAFYNYLDGMASEGEGGPVKINQDVESIKMAPMYMLVYDTVIVYVNYKCEHVKNDWGSFQDSVLSIFGDEYDYQIQVGCGGPLEWK
jgi:hypothetical protein